MQDKSQDKRGRGFAANLYSLRTNAHLTQKQVAKKLSVNRTTYTKYETGVTEPGIVTICRMASIFGVDVNTLLEGSFETQASDNEIRSELSESKEEQLIEIFRSLSPAFQKRFIAMGLMLEKECREQELKRTENK